MFLEPRPRSTGGRWNQGRAIRYEVEPWRSPYLHHMPGLLDTQLEVGGGGGHSEFSLLVTLESPSSFCSTEQSIARE